MKKAAAAQVVFIPSPGVGHLVSTLEFAKLVINRSDNRLRITILIIKLPLMGETDSYTTSLATLERLHVINLPECPLPPSSDLGASMNALLEAQKGNVKQAVSNLITEHEEEPVAAFVVDMFCTTMIDVAKEFEVPALVFFTSGVAFLGLMLHLHTLREKHQVEASELQQESVKSVGIPTFSNPVPTNCLPSAVVRKEYETFFLTYGRGLKKADGIIVNSFEELEPYAVHAFSTTTHHEEDLRLPVIYPVGPILNPQAKDYSSSSSDHDETMKWLDDQPPSSVIFLCLGSRGSFDEEQVTEIARGIENSGARFLWSMRKPPPKGSMSAPTDYATISDIAAVLPEGFLDRTAEIGKVIGWAPQARVLAHPSTGGFVSHCGWNSTLESVYFGVPIATWPLFAEQQTNAFELVCELNMAVEIALDYRIELDSGRNYLLTSDKIQRGITSLLDKDDGETGHKKKLKVKEMSQKSRQALLPAGSSYASLGRLIDYVMDQV